MEQYLEPPGFDSWAIDVAQRLRAGGAYVPAPLLEDATLDNPDITMAFLVYQLEPSPSILHLPSYIGEGADRGVAAEDLVEAVLRAFYGDQVKIYAAYMSSEAIGVVVERHESGLDTALWHRRFDLERLVCSDRDALRDLWRWLTSSESLHPVSGDGGGVCDIDTPMRDDVRYPDPGTLVIIRTSRHGFEDFDGRRAEVVSWDGERGRVLVIVRATEGERARREFSRRLEMARDELVLD